MTRTVALGAVIGFAITILALAWWERRGATGSSASEPDAGALIFLNPKLQRGVLGAQGERRVEKVIVAPLPEAGADAGAP